MKKKATQARSDRRKPAQIASNENLNIASLRRRAIKYTKRAKKAMQDRDKNAALHRKWENDAGILEERIRGVIARYKYLTAKIKRRSAEISSRFNLLKQAILSAIGENGAAESDMKEISGYRPWLLSLKASRSRLPMFAHGDKGLTRAGDLYRNVKSVTQDTRNLLRILFMHFLSAEHRSKRHSLDSFLLRNLLYDRLFENILKNEYGIKISYKTPMPQENSQYNKKIKRILEEKSTTQREALLRAMTDAIQEIILQKPATQTPKTPSHG